MLLKELKLIGFGKFKDRNLNLQEGINLIYGENEAGKSTIHSFINGMFYGFLRPGARRAQYLEEHEKYNPWDSSRYAGIISFRYKDRDYIIEREFSKGNENTKIIDENTGRDISREIDAGSNRVSQPGIHFFGFNSRVFNNTLSIKQLASKTESELAGEVTEKLINVSTSLDDNISVERTIEELRSSMAEIGTSRAPTRPYAQTIREIELLEDEKRIILNEREDYNRYLEEEERLKSLLELKEKNLSETKKELEKLELLKKAKRLQEGEILEDEIKKLEGKTNNLKSYLGFSMEDYQKAINLSNYIDNAKENLKDCQKELEDIQGKILSLKEEEKKYSSTESLDEVSKYYNEYENLEEERKKIEFYKNDSSLEFLRRDYSSINDNISKLKRIRLFSLILTIISLGSGALALVVNRFIPLLILLPVFGAVTIYYSNRIKALNPKIEEIEKQIRDIDIEEQKSNQKLQDIQKKQEAILDKYAFSSKYELKNHLEKVRMASYNKDNHINNLNEARTKENSLVEKINNYQNRINEDGEKLKDILDENNTENLDTFRQGLDKKNEYNTSMKELESKRNMLFQVIGEDSLQSLREEMANTRVDLDLNIARLDENQLRYEMDRMNQEITDNKIAINGIENAIIDFEEKLKRLVEIEEDILRKTSFKKELELKYEALDLAANTIEELSRDIHSQFAPAINKKVSNIVEGITNGRYKNIKISEDLDINIGHPSTGEMVHINSLSGGTIDQLYFALRFAIINSMAEENLPLILDDCFIQYDDNRLANILKFLKEISKERQVILFTCHKREQKILEELKYQYNLLNII